MAKIKLTGHASGTGVVTVTAPNTSTDRVITLPDSTATIATTTDVAARLPSITDNGNANAITINATENVGIEVTPESWEDNYPALQIGGQGSLGGHSGSEVYVNENVYRNSSAWKYINTAAASQYTGTGGQHKFKIAASGTADSAITWTTAMTIDNTGAVTMPAQPAFHATSTSNQNSLAINSSVEVVFAGERFDIGSNFASNTFTAPVTGKYQLTTNLRVDDIDSAATYYQIKIDTSNSFYLTLIDPDTGQDTNYWHMSLSVLADMDAGDTARVLFLQSGGTVQTDIDGDGRYSNFSGYLVC